MKRFLGACVNLVIVVLWTILAWALTSMQEDPFIYLESSQLTLIVGNALLALGIYLLGIVPFGYVCWLLFHGCSHHDWPREYRFISPILWPVTAPFLFFLGTLAAMNENTVRRKIGILWALITLTDS